MEVNKEKVDSVMERIHQNSTTDNGDLGDYFDSPPPKPTSIGAIRSSFRENMQTIESNDSNLSNQSNQTNLSNQSNQSNLSNLSNQSNLSNLSNLSNEYNPKGTQPLPSSPEREGDLDLHSLQNTYGNEQTSHEYYRRFIPNYQPSTNTTNTTNTTTNTWKKTKQTPGAKSSRNRR